VDKGKKYAVERSHRREVLHMSQTNNEMATNALKAFEFIRSQVNRGQAWSRFEPRPYVLAGIACSLFIFLLPTTTLAQTPAPEGTLPANPVFRKNCAKCHGKTAEGRHFGGPSLSSDKAATASAEDLRNIISNGKDHMPKYNGKLTSEEIDTLVQQIKSLSKK
jgi:mono/diheme cytochrome c family protein